MSPAATVQDLTGRSFVGRTREIVELSSSLDDAIAGRGRLFLISGEPGIGKTWLADEIARHAAERGMRVAWGRCWEGGGAPAYWPWVQVLRSLLVHPDRTRARPPPVTPEIGQLIPELSSETTRPTPLDPDQARFRLFDGIATMLKDAARSQPLVLIFDDLHEADQASLEMLKFVARGLHDSQIVIIGNYRDTEVRRSHTLSEAIAELLREGDQIPLSGLAETEVARMVEARAALVPGAGFVADLHRATAGNPLFVDGVVRVLIAEGKLGSAERLDLSGFKLPEGSRGAIRRRLAMLSAQAQVLLSMASVIGNEFDSRLLELVSGLSLEQIVEQTDEAVRIGILQGEAARPGIHQFSHALIRDVLYGELNANRRIELHGVIGSAIEEIHKDNLTPHLTELAHHYLCALPHGNVAKAIDYSVRAGKAAYALFAYEEVIQHWEAAAALQEELVTDTWQRASLLEDLAAPALLGLERKGVGYLEQALRLYQDLGQVDDAARAHVKMGHSLITLRNPVLLDYPLALSHFRSAETLLGENQNFRLRSSLYIGLASVAWELIQGDQGFEASRRAMEIAVRSGDELLWVQGAVAHAMILYATGGLAKAFQLMNQAWQKADELNSASAAAMTAAQACYCHAFLWNPSECEEWALRELSRPRLAHARSLRQRFFHQLAHAYVFAGTLNETRRLLVETPCLLAEANLAFYAGDWSQAESTLLRDLEEQGRRPGRPKQESFAMLWLGRLHHARSEYLGAENLLRQALAIVRGQHLYIEVDIRSELTALYVDSARANDAKSQLARCREILGNGEDWRGLTGKVARAEAIVAAADGKYEDAELQFEKSVQIFRRCHVPFEEAEALHYWGRALDASGDHGRANEKLDAAIEIYRRCGAGKRWVERVEVDRPAAPSRTDYGGQQIDQLSVAGQFRKQGHYWTVSFVGETFRLKDSKSLRVIAHLIRNPGHQFHARELAALDSPQVARRIPHHDENVGATVSTDLGDAGVVLDAQALAEYRHRLADLRPEIEEAESCNDLGRVSLLREEAEVLTAELAAGAGFQGRERRASSHSERARLSVTKNIRGAIEKIREANPVLGRHLANSIKTGYLCSYSPDPANLVLWRS